MLRNERMLEFVNVHTSSHPPWRNLSAVNLSSEVREGGPSALVVVGLVGSLGSLGGLADVAYRTPAPEEHIANDLDERAKEYATFVPVGVKNYESAKGCHANTEIHDCSLRLRSSERYGFVAC